MKCDLKIFFMHLMCTPYIPCAFPMCPMYTSL